MSFIKIPLKLTFSEYGTDGTEYGTDQKVNKQHLQRAGVSIGQWEARMP